MGDDDEDVVIERAGRELRRFGPTKFRPSYFGRRQHATKSQLRIGSRVELPPRSSYREADPDVGFEGDTHGEIVKIKNDAAWVRMDSGRMDWFKIADLKRASLGRSHAKKRRSSEAELVSDVGAAHDFVDRLKHGRTKKSPAQLDREIAEALSKTGRAHSTIASKGTSVIPPSVRVARAGLESVRTHGIKNLRYGLYRHAGDRSYQWGNFTGTPEHVITAVVPSARNTASQEALIRALKWKR
ncbi:MAG TPA: hypothetical protein VLE97_10990 [Gaiellaceae bacterium]|nr:hypothetical protein [Gaiellaceae bacterium]